MSAARVPEVTSRPGFALQGRGELDVPEPGHVPAVGVVVVDRDHRGGRLQAGHGTQRLPEAGRVLHQLQHHPAAVEGEGLAAAEGRLDRAQAGGDGVRVRPKVSASAAAPAAFCALWAPSALQRRCCSVCAVDPQRQLGGHAELDRQQLGAGRQVGQPRSGRRTAPRRSGTARAAPAPPRSS